MLRLRIRLPPHPDKAKVMIPAVLMDERVQLGPDGQLLRDNKLIPGKPLGAIRVCHFPVRDPLQYAAKVAIGYLQHRAQPDCAPHLGAPYVEPVQTFLAGGPQLLAERMRSELAKIWCAPR